MVDIAYKSIVFDFDSTIVSAESLDFLANLVLKDRSKKIKMVKKIKNITNLGMGGKITIEESLARRVSIISPNRDQVFNAGKKISKLITKSFLKNKRFFSTNAKNIYVVSAGFEEMTLPSIKMLGIKKSNVFANKFIFNRAGKVTGIDQKRLTAQNFGKVKQLQKLSLPKPVVAIGDGYTDYEIKKQGVARNFIAYTEHACRKNVVANADFVAKTFSDILKFIKQTHEK